MSALSEALARLRSESSQDIPWTLELYCRTPACPAREVQLTVKELPGSDKLRDALPCPSCRRPLVLHHARNGTETEEFRNRMAPRSDATEEQDDEADALWVRTDLIAYRGEPSRKVREDIQPCDAAAQYRWGSCPECGLPPVHRGCAVLVERVWSAEGWGNWVTCEPCRVRWCIGVNSPPGAALQRDPSLRVRASQLDGRYRQVEPGEIPNWAADAMGWDISA